MTEKIKNAIVKLENDIFDYGPGGKIGHPSIRLTDKCWLEFDDGYFNLYADKYNLLSVSDLYDFDFMADLIEKALTNYEEDM